MRSVSTQVKSTVLVAGIGVALIGVLVVYFNRRRRRRRPWKDIKSADDAKSVSSVSTVSESSLSRHTPLTNPSVSRLQNGEVRSRPGSRAAGQDTDNVDSAASMDDTLSTTSSITTVVANQGQIDTSGYEPKQLCELGMRELKVAINHWEDALDKIDNMEDDKVDRPTEELQYELSELLERAYRMQEVFESKLFKTYSANVALDAAIQEMDKEYEERRRRSVRSLRSLDDSASDVESFVSAVSFADLSDLEEQKQQWPQLALYESALLELEHGCIPCRSLRTHMLGCSSDTEFLAKLYCVREAFQVLFMDQSVRGYFADCGRQIISQLLVKADRDPEEFERDYTALLEWVQDEQNRTDMEDELKHRGVKMITFYDVVIDFLMLDAFDDLANPPSSVVSVVNNRWLSNGFKESALSTAVWSVLKAKKSMLKYPNGFMAHFYAVSEHTSSVLAWGFLGPETSNSLKRLCNVFKDAVLGFMRDVFSFDKVRYTTVEQLSNDILDLVRERLTATMQELTAST